MANNVFEMGEWRQKLNADEELAAVSKPRPLHGGGGGGTSGPMDAVEAKIAAAEARTDTKITKIDGKLDLILEKLDRVRENGTDAKSEARATRRYVVGTGLSLGALLIAIFALFSNGFNIGAKVGDVARTEAHVVIDQNAALKNAQEARELAAGNSTSNRSGSK